MPQAALGFPRTRGTPTSVTSTLMSHFPRWGACWGVGSGLLCHQASLLRCSDPAATTFTPTYLSAAGVSHL